MKKKLICFISVLFLFLTVDLKAQGLEMEPNKNRIDKDFIASPEIGTKLKEHSKLENDINLILRKANDSLYSIYIFNNTADSLKIAYQDRSLFLIQEAKNPEGNWQPIEYWEYAWCGNSYLSNKLEPYGIFKTESKIYNGNFETEIRFKLLNNEVVYYSNPVIGFINLSQFDLPNDLTEYQIHKRIATRGGIDLLNKIIFLEPNGINEFLEKEKAYFEKMSELRKKSGK